jgi:hypothetical protein
MLDGEEKLTTYGDGTFDAPHKVVMKTHGGAGYICSFQDMDRGVYHDPEYDMCRFLRSQGYSGRVEFWWEGALYVASVVKDLKVGALLQSNGGSRPQRFVDRKVRVLWEVD